MFYTQIVSISCIQVKNFLYSSSRRLLYCSRQYWCFFYFFFQKDFYIALEHISTCCLFLLSKEFGTFCVLLSEAFLCCLTIVICHCIKYFLNLFIKIFFIKIFFIGIFFIKIFFITIFFIKSFSIRIFFIRVSSNRIGKNLYIVNNTLQNLFFFNNICTFF